MSLAFLYLMINQSITDNNKSMMAETTTSRPGVPSTRKKKAQRARRVFGNSIVDDDDDNIDGEQSSTLSYSPSPRKKTAPTTAGGVMDYLGSNSSRSSSSSNTSSVREETSGGGSGGGGEHHDFSSVRRPLSVGPFDKIIAPSMDKENGALHSQATAVATSSSKSILSVTAAVTSPTAAKKNILSNSNNNKRASTTCAAIRQTLRSPLRHDLVRKTQQAIQNASVSVNQSLGAARKAKMADLRQKGKLTASFRSEWKQDGHDARAFHKAMEQSRQQVLSLQRQLSSRNSKEKAKRRELQRLANLDEIDKESKFNSSVYCDQQRKLKEEEDARRRQSTEARAKLRQNARQGQAKLQLQRIEEDHALYDERHEASVALRTSKLQSSEKRRNSFAFRNGDARRIRELFKLLEADRQRHQSQSHELERQAAMDAQAYQQELAKSRRESLARRNEYAHQQRQEQAEKSGQELRNEQESIQLELAAERDARAYQAQLAAQRRESLAGRNREGFHWQKEVDRQRNQAKNAEHDSYELKWAGEKDAEAYQRQLEKERRESLEKRNTHAREQRAQADREQHKQHDLEHESYELKWNGERDAEQYRQQLEEERRKSLVFRNFEGKRQRDEGFLQQSESIQNDHQSYELKWAGEQDAENYRLQMDKERRESLAGRNREARRQRAQQMNQSSQVQQAEHESYELKWAGEKDAEEYQRKMEQERRQSLQHRNKERVRHQKVMQELESIARERETESKVLKWAAEEDAKSYLARLEEERRQTLQQSGQQVMHGRQVENEQHVQAMELAHQDEELRAADQRKVNEYRKQCAERDRASLEFRRKEARAQRIEENERALQQQRIDSQNFELETEARGDVKEYVSDCKARRRLSLAFRAKEKRCHAEWKREQDDKERGERSREVQGRLMDQRHVELARMNERAKIAMDAINHAGCSFNPFANAI
jgi:hypothetical protein